MLLQIMGRIGPPHINVGGDEPGTVARGGREPSSGHWSPPPIEAEDIDNHLVSRAVLVLPLADDRRSLNPGEELSPQGLPVRLADAERGQEDARFVGAIRMARVESVVTQLRG